MNYLKLLVKDFIKNRLPKPKLFSTRQTIIFIAACIFWFVFFKSINLLELIQSNSIIHFFPLLYVFFLLPCYFYGFIINDQYRSALPFTGRLPILNAITHGILFCFTVYLFL